MQVPAGLCVLSLNLRGIAMAWHFALGTFIAVALIALTVSIAFRGPPGRENFDNLKMG